MDNIFEKQFLEMNEKPKSIRMKNYWSKINKCVFLLILL